MSEQGTEKTNPLHGLERDGTGTGVWAHPAAEPEQRRCECGQSEFDGRVWSWRGVGTRRVCVANSTLSGYCPSCGCRLSVVDGEPRVGEPYADLERDARRFRVVEKAMGSPLDSPFNTHRWHFETDGMDMRYAALGEYADALLGGETDLTHGGSSPAGDWREPMVDTSNSSNPTEIGSPPPGHWAAAWKRAASKFRAWQADTDAALELERRAVDKLAEHIEIACEGFSHGSMSAITVAPGGYMDAAEIAAWARNRAREEGGE